MSISLETIKEINYTHFQLVVFRIVDSDRVISFGFIRSGFSYGTRFNFELWLWKFHIYIGFISNWDGIA
ncbi:MAG: hypothetical protein IT569_00585 [Leptospiraceae bacterium]|nr:hypothetical protein [Leptospiraceae bacterium]